MKMTYSEQLRHPNWQRKRLEALNHYGFECGSCGDKERMLHVHHKRYVKGRKAWEYEVDELEVRCELCHEEAHFLKQRLEILFADGPQREILSLVAGYMVGSDLDDLDPGRIEECRQAGGQRAYILGLVANHLNIAGPAMLRDVLQALLSAKDAIYPPIRYDLEEALALASEAAK